MKQAIKEAILHVRSFYPEVSILVFNAEGMWQYMTSDFDHPSFEGNDRIDISILEVAADSVDTFPAIFQLGEEDLVKING